MSHNNSSTTAAPLVNVNAADSDGDTAIHHAGSVAAIQCLVEQGHANPHLVNAQGKTALQAKQEELDQLLQDPEEDDDCEDAESLKRQIAYLSSLSPPSS